MPFLGFKIKHHSGQTLSFPLSDKSTFRLDASKKKFVNAYAKALQKKVMDKGEFLNFMEEFQDGKFEKDTVSVDFPAAKDKIKHPDFTLEFEYFRSAQTRGFWAIIPALGLEAFAVNEEQLEERLRETVKFEFTQRKRLVAVQNIVSAIWFNESELIEESISLKAPSLKEVDDYIDEKSDNLLPQVAKPLKINKPEAFGREKELNQLATALTGKFNRNVLIVGPSGVGKTALIWELTRRQRKYKIKGTIWETTASTLIKELTRDTGWQDNIEFLIQELTKSNDFLYIRNLMELFEVGKYEGNSVSIADYLKTAISRGEINIISECTEEERAQIDLQSPNYLSNFQVITLEAPSDQLENIIMQKVEELAKAQQVTIDKGAIAEALRLNKRFSPYAGMPGKPIRFLESMLLNKNQETKENSYIGQAEVIRHFCDDTGIPAFIADPNIPMDVEQVKAQFKEQLYGQEQAIEKLSDVLAQVKTALSRTGKPIASFLFVGPTGVGKTELAKLLAAFMFNSREKVVRFDMSEFSTSYDIIRLSGLGNQKDGLLTSAVLREPFSVLLFDEIEKAHPSFYDLLLQILGEGRLTDSRGRLVNFCSSIIIMTSNIGAEQFQLGKIGWMANENQDTNELFIAAVQKHFKPELFNRIDQVIPFLPLEKGVIKKVVAKEIQQIREREGIKHRDIKLNIDENIYDLLVAKGYSPKYGARQMQRTIREELLIPLARELNENVFDEQLIVDVKAEEEKVVIQSQVNPMGFELLLEELELHVNTNHVGTLRRHSHQLKEGYFYNHLMSELDILEQLQQENSEQFWEDPNNKFTYRTLTEIRSKLDQLMQSIEKIEIDLGLSCMKLRGFTGADKAVIDQWEANYLELKKDIYSVGNKGSDQVFLTIYATDIEIFFDFYLEILRRKQYDVEVKGIWYSENLQESLAETNNQELIQANRKRTKGYFKTAIEPRHYSNIEPIAESAILNGVELKVNGKCAKLFFEEEEGFQRWIKSEEEEEYAHVSLSDAPMDFPTQLHRGDYFTKQNARRTIAFPIVKDTIYKINRESRKQDLTDLFAKHIENRFKEKLESAFL